MKIDYYSLSTGIFDPAIHTGATLEVKTSRGPTVAAAHGQEHPSPVDVVTKGPGSG